MTAPRTSPHRKTKEPKKENRKDETTPEPAVPPGTETFP